MNKPGSDSAAPGRGSGGRGAAGKNQNRRGRGAGRGRENTAGSKERDASSKDTEGNRGNARTGPAYKPYNNNKKKNDNSNNRNNNNLDREFKICVRDLPVHGFGDEEFLDAVAMLEEAFLPAWTRPEPEPELEPEPEVELATEGAGAPPPAPDGEAPAATATATAAAAAVKEKPPLRKPARPKHPQAGTLLSVSHLLEGHVSRTRGPLPGVGFIRVRQEALFQGMLRCGAAISRHKHAHEGSPEGETAAAAAAVVGADTAAAAAATETTSTSTATATTSTATDADAAVAAEEEALASTIAAAYPNLQQLMERFAGERAAHPDFEAAPYVQ